MVWTLGFGLYSSLFFFFFLSALLENGVFLIKSSFQTAHWLPVSPVFPSLLEMKAGEILDQKWMWEGQRGLKGSSSGFTHIRAGLSAEHFPECRRATTCGNVVFYIYRKSLGCTVLKGFDHMMKNCSRLKRWPDCVWLSLWKRRDPVNKFDCLAIKPAFLKKIILYLFFKMMQLRLLKRTKHPLKCRSMRFYFSNTAMTEVPANHSPRFE